MPAMNANLPLFIGLRYIRSKRRNGFVSFISLLSFIAMALGVMALILVLSVMNGFDREIRERILSVVSHAALVNEKGVADWQALGDWALEDPGVKAFAPFVEGYGLLTSDTGSQGVLLHGVDPRYEQGVSPVTNHMLVGDFSLLQPGEYGIVLGNLLARSLGVIRGDHVMLSLPELNVTPAGIFPRYKRFRVLGVFQVGAQVDSGMAFIHYQDAQKLYRMSGRVSGVRLRVDDPYGVDMVATRLRSESKEGLVVKTWTGEMGNLFQAIEMEKKVVGLLLAAIVAVAAFNIVASLTLMVADKRRDIAVLRTLGAEGKTISRIFRIQGTAVGLFGVVTGVICGCLMALGIADIVGLLERYLGFQVFDPDVYFISELPSRLMWQDVLAISLLGVFLSLIATLYPAHRAAKVLPAEALRYDH
ncbi:lipoprotein-releasing ABC transporter permease subunit [Porticoccus litoralis]|uniref:Lipoprotein-releasing ABC transporter permease subunit n=1 Tax=Porticoccus litoralis TaxID=434086 RepID=A0AAW8B201_9GAMM|nr:lipoprotein-releasing ABC transporter permease subunit [Porticoccus litoralis]MDP1519789.1 lipoprotein-releasing ABC transporter permease subunit [Porticoccus litoralis]